MPPLDSITAHQQEACLFLTMNSPPVNAMSRAFMEELAAHLAQCVEDPDVRVVAITSGLPVIYSAGADVRELVGLDRAGCEAFVKLGHETFDRITTLPKPVIAAIHGICVGGGLEMAMACDFRIAADGAEFGQPEVDLGLVSGWGATQRLTRLVGRTRALEMLMTGARIKALRALAVGLVNRVVPAHDLLLDTRRLAHQLSQKSASALRGIKEAVNRGAHLSLAEGLAAEGRCFTESYQAPDAAEGLRAFLEKRRPNFQA